MRKRKTKENKMIKNMNLADDFHQITKEVVGDGTKVLKNIMDACTDANTNPNISTIRQKVDTVKDRVEKEKECRAVSVSETKLSLHVQKMTGHVNNVVQDPMKKIKEGLSSKEQKLDHVQKMTGHVNNVVQDPMKKI
jgi:glutamyl-tRNA reductase